MPDIKLYLCPTLAKIVAEVTPLVGGPSKPNAITIGGTVIYVTAPDERIVRHEQVHIQQQAAMAPWWAKWLPLRIRAWAGLPRFAPLYLAEHRTNGYVKNKYEIEARAAE
jgi:hypothetical protein